MINVPNIDYTVNKYVNQVIKQNNVVNIKKKFYMILQLFIYAVIFRRC